MTAAKVPAMTRRIPVAHHKIPAAHRHRERQAHRARRAPIPATLVEPATTTRHSRAVYPPMR